MTGKTCDTCAHYGETLKGPNCGPCSTTRTGPEFPKWHPVGSIGDITSTAKGSGARYNAGKPPFDLLPLSALALAFPEDSSPARAVLERLGAFQASHDAGHVLQAILALGAAAWVEAAQVFDYGRRKYAAWNWAKGMPWSVPLACAARHCWAMLHGEELDPESGLPHRGHVLCNLLMLLTYSATYTEGNDLPAPGLLAI